MNWTAHSNWELREIIVLFLSGFGNVAAFFILLYTYHS